MTGTTLEGELLTLVLVIGLVLAVAGVVEGYRWLRERFDRQDWTGESNTRPQR